MNSMIQTRLDDLEPGDVKTVAEKKPEVLRPEVEQAIVEWELGQKAAGLGGFDVDSCGCGCGCS